MHVYLMSWSVCKNTGENKIAIVRVFCYNFVFLPALMIWSEINNYYALAYSHRRTVQRKVIINGTICMPMIG